MSMAKKDQYVYIEIMLYSILSYIESFIFISAHFMKAFVTKACLVQVNNSKYSRAAKLLSYLNIEKAIFLKVQARR